MVDLYRSLFRHFQLKNLGRILIANVFCTIPFLIALVGPAAVVNDPALGLSLLLSGFFFTGLALAVTGRWIAQKANASVPASGGFLKRFLAVLVEGGSLALCMVILFSLATRSAPYYWSLGGWWGFTCLATLGLGVLLILGSAPFFLPARRTENLGIFRAARRAVVQMNRHPLLSILLLVLSFLAFAASLLTVGLFPGFAGLAALHQGAWDHEQELEQSS